MKDKVVSSEVLETKRFEKNNYLKKIKNTIKGKYSLIKLDNLCLFLVKTIFNQERVD